SGLGRRNRCGSRRSLVLGIRLGPERVVDEDARDKRREERYGHDERRFHSHGRLSSILPKESYPFVSRQIEMDDPPIRRRRKDYDDRRRRQGRGLSRQECRPLSRPPRASHRLAGIAAMLAGGASWSTVQKATGCSRATVAKVARRAQASGETASA